MLNLVEETPPYRGYALSCLQNLVQTCYASEKSVYRISIPQILVPCPRQALPNGGSTQSSLQLWSSCAVPWSKLTSRAMSNDAILPARNDPSLCRGWGWRSCVGRTHRGKNWACRRGSKWV